MSCRTHGMPARPSPLNSGIQGAGDDERGYFWSLGRPDNGLVLDEMLEHFRAIAPAVALPVNADFEAGFADDPEQLATNVKLAAATGIAGLSIEDSTRNAAEPLYQFDLAVERIRAARRAIDETGTGVVLTGRSEGFVVGLPDIEETIRRLKAYADAGADCLYAPRIESVEHVSAIVDALSPKPRQDPGQRPVHHRPASRRPWRAPNQRRRGPGTHRVGGLPSSCTGDRSRRHVLLL